MAAVWGQPPILGGAQVFISACPVKSKAQRGIKGCSWKKVLAVHKALENTPTRDDPPQGRSGPFPIRQRTA